MASHERTLKRLKALLKEKSVDEKVVEKIQRRLNKHKAFGVDIKQGFTNCKDIVRYGVPDIVDDADQLKDKGIWIIECQNVLNTSLNVSRADVLDMKEIGENMERMVTMEIVIRDIIFNTSTHQDNKYLEHIQKYYTILDN